MLTSLRQLKQKKKSYEGKTYLAAAFVMKKKIGVYHHLKTKIARGMRALGRREYQTKFILYHFEPPDIENGCMVKGLEQTIEDLSTRAAAVTKTTTYSYYTSKITLNRSS